MRLYVSVKGLSSVTKNLKNNPTSEIAKYAVLRSSQFMEDKTIELTKQRVYAVSKNKDLTGRLLGGVQNKELQNGFARRIIQNPQLKGAETNYAKPLDEGQKAHVIKAKNKKVLAVPLTKWFGVSPTPYGAKGGLPKLSKNGKFVILGRQVNHPGKKGLNFFTDAVKETRKQASKILKESFKKFYK